MTILAFGFGCRTTTTVPGAQQRQTPEPPSQLLAFVGETDWTSNASDLYIVDFRSEKIQRIHEGEPRAMDPVWSPDADFIIFSKEAANVLPNRPFGVAHLWRIDPDGSNLKELTVGTGFDLPERFLARDERILFTRQEPKHKTAYFSIRSDGQGLRQELDIQNSFSPDGFWALKGRPISDNEDEHVADYWITSVRNGQSFKLNGLRGQVRYPQWMPDSAKLFVEHEGDAKYRWMTIELPSMKVKPVVIKGHPQIGGLRLSPTGRLIAFSSRGTNKSQFAEWDVYVASPDGSNVRRLPSSCKSLYMIGWSLDEKWIIAGRDEDRSILSLHSVTTNEERTIECHVGVYSPVLAPKAMR